MKPPPEEEASGNNMQQERDGSVREDKGAVAESLKGDEEMDIDPGFGTSRRRRKQNNEVSSGSKKESRSKGFQLLSMFRQRPKKRSKRMKKSTGSRLA